MATAASTPTERRRCARCGALSRFNASGTCSPCESTATRKSEPLNWFDLYKLYEIVRDSVDPAPPSSGRKGSQAKLIATGWITKDDLSAFTGSANHQGASGQDARHAREPGPAPSRMLTLAEGRSLIMSLVSSWLSSLT